MPSDDLAPLTEPSLEAYFRDQIADRARKIRPKPKDDTCWYLGHMLARFGRSEHLFEYREGEQGLRPLALLYGDAREARSDRERCLLLQQLGDLALFLGAVFPERYRHRGIQREYVVAMGGSAYDYLASNAPRNRHVFEELSRMFAELLHLAAAACSRPLESDDTAILHMYRRWSTSRDPELARQLEGLGIQLETDDTLH